MRILKRPFAADSYLNDLLNETIVRKHSVVQRIWRSPVLSTRLRNRIKASGAKAGGSAANLNAAKHRFESFSAPLGRMLLHLEEFLDEVQETCEDRGNSKEGDDCWNWLDGLDDEKLYQLGMLADCADEILMATRAVDTENVDTSTMHTAARNLLNRLDALFNKRQCLEIPGYTQHVMQILKRTRIIHGPSQMVKTIGGNDANAALASCFHRMAAYTALVADVVQTEFPDYELFCAFSVFDLSGGNAGECDAIALQRLAQAFNVNYVELKDQYHRIRMVALQKKKDGVGISNKEAWQQTVQACRSNKRWTSEALLPVLVRFAGWTASTSGVEQNFSKALKTIGAHRFNMTHENEETAIKFAVYQPDNEEELKTITANARKLWDRHYGPARAVTMQRLDKGTRRLASAANSETAWLDHRRAAAMKVGKEFGNSSNLTIEAAAEGVGWTASHDKEHAFQAKKRAKKKLSALEDGILLHHEIHPGMQQDLEQQRLKDEKADRRARSKFLEKQQRQKPATLTIKPASKAFIDDVEARDIIASVLHSKRVLLSDDPAVNIHLLVVKNPTNLSKRLQWIAALSGALVCSAEAVLHLDAQLGCFLKFERAIEKKKKIHITDNFEGKHRMIATLLREACQMPDSQWKISVDPQPKCVMLGGPAGLNSKALLRNITRINKKESRVR